MKPLSLEDQAIMKLTGQLLEWKLPEFDQREYQFDEVRSWRIDVFWTDYQVGLELEGGLDRHGGVRGRHLRPEGYEGDIRKYNAAQLAGILLLRTTYRMLYAGELKKPLTDALRVDSPTGILPPYQE